MRASGVRGSPAWPIRSSKPTLDSEHRIVSVINSPYRSIRSPHRQLAFNLPSEVLSFAHSFGRPSSNRKKLLELGHLSEDWLALSVSHAL